MLWPDDGEGPSTLAPVTLPRTSIEVTTGNWNTPFTHGQFPRGFESRDWDWEHRGPVPRFWRYFKHSACHWLVNFNLRFARLVEPDRPWWILTSEAHSTMWDGKRTLFEFNFLALGISADDCFALACVDHPTAGEGATRRSPAS